MLKLIGACMTVAACGNMGLTWARVFEQRPRQLAALEAALQLLETEILYGATPLPQAMVYTAQKCEPGISGIFGVTAAELARMDGVTAGEAWNKSVDTYYPASALNSRDLSILRRFGASLGISDKEDQAKHLQMAKKQLRAAAAEAETLAKRNSTMYKYLGFLAGLLMVLVLY